MAAKVPVTPGLPKSTGARTLEALERHVGALVLALFRVLGEHAKRLNGSLNVDGTDKMTKPLVLAVFTVATRPAAASWTGGVIFVSDGGAGAVFQGSNGSAWVNLG